MLRKLGFKKHEPRESEARLKLRKELFAYTQCGNHGFPHKPSALAYDPLLKLLAIGTSTGSLRIIGAPGVEYAGQHPTEDDVVQVHFIPDQGRLITVCCDNSVHLWEINVRDGKSVLEHVKQFAMESSKNTSITGCAVASNGETFLVGTQGGSIFYLDIATFKLAEYVLYQDMTMQNAPEDYKVNPGGVEAIAEQPGASHNLLIGYNRGLLVLWDTRVGLALQTYNAGQQLESVAWFRDGTQFMTSHIDGSHVVWNASDATKPVEQTTPYGPFPCKAINKVAWKSTKTDPFIIFSGGMPRASYGDRHTVSVQQGPKHTVFDFTSKVIDFIVICDGDGKDTEYDEPQSLIVLAKEDLVGIDLQSDGWQQLRLPYLSSLHSSAITCASHVSGISDRLYKQISDAGDSQFSEYSNREWPITGGRNLAGTPGSRDLLLTGHEDGSVRFYDASTSSLRLLYKVGTSQIFTEGTIEQPEGEAEDEWPPFRKVGTFDPYSDDPRLGIQKILMCPLSETLVVGGTAGQVVVLRFVREEQKVNEMPVMGNIVSDRDTFVWKGHEALTPRNEVLTFHPGFQPVGVMQLYPPASCTALALQSDWRLVAAGTAHGMAVFDYQQVKTVITQCTLNPEDLAGGENAINRKKSFKKSLRESFRRLRSRRRSGRVKKKEDSSKLEEQKGSPSRHGDPAAGPSTQTETVQLSEGKNVERQVEARTDRAVDDTLGSMVRILYFADTFLLAGQGNGPTLWMGTNHGTIFAYRLVIPGGEQRKTEAVSCQLAKEIQLKHHAPVISLCVVDRTATPLPESLAVQCGVAKAADMTGMHHLILASEEQFKVFSLPHLKALNKFKLTAHEGSRIRRVNFLSYRSKSDENYCESDLTCLTNQGELQIYSIPALRRQLHVESIRKENAMGITSGLFTQDGQGFYLDSPSEYTRFSLSACKVVTPWCTVELREGARPFVPEPPTPEEPSTPDSPPGTTNSRVSHAQMGPGAAPAATATSNATTTSGIQPAGGVPEDMANTSAVTDRSDESTERPNDSVMTIGSDSISPGDITADSVRVHMSEETHKSEVHQDGGVVTTQTVEGGTVTTKVVEKRVVTKRSHVEEHGMIMKTSQKVILQSGSGSPTETRPEPSETKEYSARKTLEQLSELRITRNGEDVEVSTTQSRNEMQISSKNGVQAVVDVHVNGESAPASATVST